MDTPLTFGQWLRRRRKTFDLTQEELATRVPCAKGTIRRLEADDLRPSKQLVERLAEVLEIPEQKRADFLLFARSAQPLAFDLLTLPSQELRADLLPTSPSHQRQYAIPIPANSLLGRYHAVGVVSELVLRPDVRLVTLTGPPGVGKTRLALEVARHIQPNFREGACFVSLAPLREGKQVLQAIAQVIDLLDTGRSVSAALTDRLRYEELVLVLDNFEHVMNAAPKIAELLAGAPSLKLLCTSRIPLRILGEHEFVVPPLALPDPDHPISSVALETNPAIALFAARARAVYPSFVITSENLPQIAEICLRLDGLPLAIELAATRSKLFTPVALLARLDRRLPFLTGGARDAPARQQTLEAAIAWSYDLLNEMEKTCLCRFSVFRGGWTLEAAEAVCGDDKDVLDTLAALVDHSLVQSNHLETEEVRFNLLETVREFALTRLNERGEFDWVQIQHAQYFLSLAVQSERGLQGREQVAWMSLLNAENNNLRAAFAWSLSEQGDAALGLQAGAALWWFWWTNGQVGEGRQWFRQLLQRAREVDLTGVHAYGRALLGSGILAFFAGDFADAMPHFEQARDLGAKLNDRITQGYAIFMIGTVLVLINQGEEGRAVVKEGASLLSSARPLSDWHVGVTSLAQTLLTFERGDLVEAQQHADNGMAIFSQLGQPYGIGLALNYQGDVARLRGDYAMAATRYEAALPLLRQANAKSEIPAVLHNYAHVLLAKGDTYHAHTLFSEALELHREIGNRMGMVECLIGLAFVTITLGQTTTAETFLERADRLLAELNVPLFATEQVIYQQITERIQQIKRKESWDDAHQGEQ